MVSARALKLLITSAALGLAVVTIAATGQAQIAGPGIGGPKPGDGERLFKEETFGGNGRTCQTCHSAATGTVSPEDAQKLFAENPNHPLFVHDGSDDGFGNGVDRMLADATVLVEIPLPPNVRLADDPEARSVFLRRGIPSTLNTPALDRVLMLDGRERNLLTQAASAVRSHYQGREATLTEALRIAAFQRTDGFFSSEELRNFARGGPAPTLPQGNTESERRGRIFFEDIPVTDPTQKAGSCAACHSGPMLNRSSKFFPLLPPGTRFQSIAVSEFNVAGNPVRKFIFTNPDGSETVVESPDPGRALITGVAESPTFDQANAFKIPTLWGVDRTAPYFHDNSAKTLEDVVEHYDLFFNVVTQGALDLTEQDKADIVAYMKLLR
jgi:cytochrome c peroxidase